MAVISIPRTKRPRDAYKVTTDLGGWPNPAAQINLQADRIVQEGDRWAVHFRQLLGYKRTKAKKIPPFWDTDLGNAVLRWNTENGGDPKMTGCYGSRFVTPNAEDAMMMRMAFS